MPYHALTGPERETFNARRTILEHLGHLLRSAAVACERHRTLADEQAGKISKQSICCCTGIILSHCCLTPFCLTLFCFTFVKMVEVEAFSLFFMPVMMKF